jgi:hypothetical protein
LAGIIVKKTSKVLWVRPEKVYYPICITAGHAENFPERPKYKLDFAEHARNGQDNPDTWPALSSKKRRFGPDLEWRSLPTRCKRQAGKPAPHAPAIIAVLELWDTNS